MLMFIDMYDKRILSVASGKGSEHDFSIFKRAFGWAHPDVLMLGDSGFQGICGIHRNSWIPYKKARGGNLSEAQKAENRQLSSYRICIEHAIRYIKRFKIWRVLLII